MPSTGTCVQTNCNCHIFHYILGWDIFEIMTMIETRFRPIKHVATIFLLWLICLPGCARQTTSAWSDRSHHAIRSRKAMNFTTSYDDRSALISNVFIGDAKLAFSGLGASSSFNLSGAMGFHVFVHFEDAGITQENKWQ